MKTRFRRYALFALVVVADLFLSWQYPARGSVAMKSSLDYLVEMFLFIPPIFVLVGLLDVWVPRQIVEKNVGPDSGVRGVVISILVATAAAGPLYAGFPVADALLRKGCRLANAVIFLGTWATIKIPMLMMEVKFVGLPFALLRLALTLPAIIATGYLVEMILKAGEPGRFAQGAGEKNY
ncbi:Predicted permease [Desulfofundulus australicus DSM 11792]|uniref:Predicted permease n=1 Tax=Desulfofundulus australicus DSM 11792 TaxID=1121425 RepID=A0A1M4WCZ1_9FIRM|nr:permease [Desulfofundulus australicus]SHE79128.1 Predicted permease [Desulfofundulus australicus DSM 11792]